MAGRYWKTALLLFALGLLFIFVILSYSFFGYLLCGTSLLVLLFGLIHRLKLIFPVSMGILRRILRTLVALVILAAVITGIWIGAACGGAENPKSDYVIVLGAGVRGDVPSRSLRERLEATQAYLEEYPNAVAVLSGGQGDGENLTEALCMFNWLTENGIPTNRLRIEDKAASTEENIRFSLDLIEAEAGMRPKTAAVVSSEYHLRRASVLAEKEGLTILGWPADTTSPTYLCNMFLREIAANWYLIARDILGLG